MRSLQILLLFLKIKKMDKILVVGSSGFIGRHVVDCLIERGHEVVCLSHTNPKDFCEAIRVIKCDVSNPVEVAKVLGEEYFENCIYLPWFTGPKCHGSIANLDWLKYSLEFLKIFCENSGKKIFMAGSVSEYDFSYGYFNEDSTPLNNSSLYGQTKASLFRLATLVCANYGVKLQWGRIFNCYGPFEKPARLMPTVIKNSLSSQNIPVSLCDKYQDYLYVKDVGSAIVALINSDLEGPFNICSGQPLYLRDIVKTIIEITSSKSNVLWGAIPESFEDRFVVGNNQKITQLTGWKPQYPLIKGLTETIEFYKTNY